MTVDNSSQTRVRPCSSSHRYRDASPFLLLVSRRADRTGLNEPMAVMEGSMVHGSCWLQSESTWVDVLEGTTGGSGEWTADCIISTSGKKVTLIGVLLTFAQVERYDAWK